MNSILKHLSIATRLLGSEVAEAALSANVARDQQLDVNFQSLKEVLQSFGFENHLSKRSLQEIPSLAAPLVLILKNQEALVVASISGSGTDREYLVYQGDAPAQTLSFNELNALYAGFCWFIKQKVATSDDQFQIPPLKTPWQALRAATESRKNPIWRARR